MSASPQIGLNIAHYRLIEKLGEGGMGVVWLAEDIRLSRQVALKFLPPDAGSDPVHRQRFEQEARAAAALSHPGIAIVHEFGECEGQMYIVFERVHGDSLRNLIAPGGLPVDELLSIAVDLADAIAAAHAAGVVHRDLKPENVMRTPDSHCKILDFGLARFTAASESLDTLTRSRLTADGAIVGTVGYMSPEQLEGKELDFRSDIFSLGTLLYELATGIHPYSGDTPASTIAAIMTSEPPPLTQRNQLQPAELERIVRKCLRKKRDERYQSTRDLAVDLRDLRREQSRGTSAAQIASAPLPAEVRPLMSAKAGRRWWWMHQLSTMFIITPVAIYLLWKAHGFVPASWRLTMTLTATFSLALNWNVRLAMFNATIGNPADLAARMRRMRQWVLWTGWPIVALFAVLTFVVAPGSEGLAIALGAMTTGGIVSLAFLYPLVERAAFPTIEMYAPTNSPKLFTARSWWWLHSAGIFCIGVSGTFYLTWRAASLLKQTWAFAVAMVIFATSLLYALLRMMIVFFLFFIPEGAAQQAHRTELWERILATVAFGAVFVLAVALMGNDVSLAVFLAVWATSCLTATHIIAPTLDRRIFPR